MLVASVRVACLAILSRPGPSLPACQRVSALSYHRRSRRGIAPVPPPASAWLPGTSRAAQRERAAVTAYSHASYSSIAATFAAEAEVGSNS